MSQWQEQIQANANAISQILADAKEIKDHAYIGSPLVPDDKFLVQRDSDDTTSWAKLSDIIGSNFTPTLSGEAAGDILVYDGINYKNLGAGTDGQVLTANAAAPDGVEWSTPAGALNLQAVTDNGRITTKAIRAPKFELNTANTYIQESSGKLQIANNLDIEIFQVGGTSMVLNATDLKFKTTNPTGFAIFRTTNLGADRIYQMPNNGGVIPISVNGYLADALGNISLPSAGINPLTTKGDIFTYSTQNERLGVGTDGQVLSADSLEPTGLKWINVGGGGGDVTKVGVPADSQIGVWTGDGTIEGTNKFTWNDATSVLTLGLTSDLASISFGATTLSYNDATGDFVLAGGLTTNFISIVGGTASQFLKADGSIDSSVYLTDAPSNGNEYVRKDGAWAIASGGGGGATQLSELSDVNTSTPTNRNVLVADGVDWESRALTEADISDLQPYLLAADLSGYVPYTGATTDVDVGVRQIKANTFVSDGEPGVTGGSFQIRKEGGFALSAGHVAVSSGSANRIRFTDQDDANAIIFDWGAIANFNTRILTVQDANGTIAYTSDIISSHTGLSDIGTNTHAQIDSHIADSTIHFTQASISITESQISDLQAYLLNINGETLSDLSDIPNEPTGGVGEFILKYSDASGDAHTWEVINSAFNKFFGTTAGTVAEGNHTHTESDITDLQNYLLTEVNDLTSAVTWANVPDINITQSSVIQHQAALTITESQISDFGTYDNYQSFNLKTDNVQRTTIQSGNDLDFVGGANVTVSYGAGGVVTIASTAGGGSPLTTKGDLFTYDTGDQRLGVGTNGQVLSANSATGTGLEWIDAPTGGSSFGATTEIPYMNATGDDFLYSANLIFNGSQLILSGANSSSTTMNGSQINVTSDFGSGSFILNPGTDLIQWNSNGRNLQLTFPELPTANRVINLQDGDGTLAFLSDITGGGANQLNELTDVSDSTQSNRNVLVSNGTTFISRALVLADISDYTAYTLPQATATVRGGVELFSNTVQSVAANAVSTTASRTYGVQLNGADQMVVNVPWVNTTYSEISDVNLQNNTGTVTGLISGRRIHAWANNRGLTTANITAWNNHIADSTIHFTQASISITESQISDFGTYSTDIHANITALNAVSGTNTGDQTSIVGITGTKAQFDTALTDGNFKYVGDAPTAHTHVEADITDLQAYLLSVDISDINATGTADGTTFLRGDGVWAAVTGGGANQLNELSDVSDSTQLNRNVLVSNGTSFVSRALVEADISDLGAYITDISSFTTSDLTEGTNLYFTDERAQDAVGNSLSNSGTIAFTYNDASNFITANIQGSSIGTSLLAGSVVTSLGLADTSAQPGDNVSIFTNDAGYLTSFTEVNDLTAAVVWANVPDANITQSSVTQHQAALTITESQISDLQTYLTAAGGTMTGALIARDHGTGTSPEMVNVTYGTSATPPAVGSVPEGTLYIQHAV